MNETQLRRLFQPFGEIENVKIMVDRVTNTRSGLEYCLPLIAYS